MRVVLLGSRCCGRGERGISIGCALFSRGSGALDLVKEEREEEFGQMRTEWSYYINNKLGFTLS